MSAFTEEEKELIIQHSSDLLVMTGFDGCFKRVSPAFTNTLGWSGEELLSRPYVGFVHSDDRQATSNMEAAVIRTKKTIGGFENRYLCKDGTFRWISWHMHPLVEKQLILAIGRDVTERRQIEEELQKNAEKYRSIFETTALGFFHTTLEGEFIIANDALARFLGYESPEDLISCVGSIGTQIYACPEDREEVLRLLRDRGSIVNFEARFRRKDGSTDWGSISAQPVRDRRGNILYIQGTFEDISKRKQAEEALERRIVALTRPITDVESIVFEDLFNLPELQRLQDMVAKAWGVAALITHPDGTPITQPSNFCRLCGEIIRKTEKGVRNCAISDAMVGRYNPSGPIIQLCLSAGLCNAGASISVGGRHIANWLIGQVRNEAQTEERIIEYAREIGVDETLFREAFRNVPVMSWKKFEQIARALFALANQLSTAAYQNIQQARFITEHKRMEEELRRSHEELERRVRERTEELQKAYDRLLSEAKQRHQAEEQLLQVQKMEAVGTLAGGIAHDFNNMLAVIIGNAELALDDIKGPPRENIKQILGASERSRELVKQILTFTRKGESQKKALKLTPLLKETVTLLRGSLPATIHMRLDIQTDSDTILANSSHIQQVLMNLSTNAAHAMENGGTLAINLSEVTIREGASQDPAADLQPGRYVKLTVKDTGVGMPVEVQKRVFDPFFTTKEPGQGTGMGLAVVFGIVKSHGGAIAVSSAVGKGSVFSIFFPAVGEAPQEEPICDSSLPKGDERVLVVDDEPSVAEITSETLKRLGYQVTTAESASEGWKRFERNPHVFDLVITDYVMPRMTGIRLAEKMLRIRKDLPIILCTGYSEMVSPEKAKAVGISEFVMKPVVRQEVAQIVRRVLDSREDDY